MSWSGARGIVVRGYRAASGRCRDPRIPRGTIRPQLRFFRGLPGFGARMAGGVVPGTINVRVAHRIVRPGRATHLVRAVRWTRHVAAENFLFSPCTLGHRGRAHPGWLYIPDPATKPGLPPPGDVIEVLAGRVAGLRYGAAVTLRYPAGAIDLVPGTPPRNRRRSAL